MSNGAAIFDHSLRKPTKRRRTEASSGEDLEEEQDPFRSGQKRGQKRGQKPGAVFFLGGFLVILMVFLLVVCFVFGHVFQSLLERSDSKRVLIQFFLCVVWPRS